MNLPENKKDIFGGTSPRYSHKTASVAHNGSRVVSADIGYNFNHSSSDDDLHSLRQHPLINEFSKMDPGVYELVRATNPTLRLFVDLAKRIVAGGGE